MRCKLFHYQLRLVSGSKKEELYGTWINEEYKGRHSAPFEVMVISNEGIMYFYKTEKAVWETDIEVSKNGWIIEDFHVFTIEDKWTDSDSNIWYKVKAAEGSEDLGEKKYLLMRISDLNRVIEFMVSSLGYADDTTSTKTEYAHRTYYRQE